MRMINKSPANKNSNNTGGDVERYTTKSMKLSSIDWTYCLYDIIRTSIPWSYLGSVGGRIIYPSQSKV